MEILKIVCVLQSLYIIIIDRINISEGLSVQKIVKIVIIYHLTIAFITEKGYSKSPKYKKITKFKC